MRRRPLLLVAISACAVVVSACGGSAPVSTAAGPSGGGDRATVVRVVDGDTLVVKISGRDERVRLIGIDTPESVKPNTPVQCFALEASARTKALLPGGTPVRLERDAELRDHYNRLLAYVYRVADGLFVNLALAREGFAQPYTYPPNVAHSDDFVAAASEARQSRRGLWNRCRDPAAPLDAASGNS